MARRMFGGGITDVYLIEDAEGDLQPGGGHVVQFYDAETGGTQYTDLLTITEQPTTFITTSDGSDGRAEGQIPRFLGPDNIYEMWATVTVGAAQTPRFLMTASDLGAYLGPVKQDVDDHLSPGNINPHGTTFPSLMDVDQAAWDAASPGVTLVKNVDGTIGVGNAPTPMTDIVWVAASDAPGQFSAAPYQCDGTADDVQIQQAIDNALGLRVGLSPGTFNLAAPINLVGSDDVDVERSRYLLGCGTYATVLNVGTGVAGGIFLGNAVSPHVSDLSITVGGSSHGIYATRSLTPAAGNRSFFHGSIRNIAVKGPWNGSHSGWALSLGSGFRYTVDNVEVGGTGNGIRVVNESADFNCGDSTFTRCFVDLTGANATAYHVSSPAGNGNQIRFDTCHSIADSAYAGTVAWKFDGAGNTSHIRGRNLNVEQFATTVSIAATASDIDLDFVHVTQRAGSAFASVAGYSNRVRVGLLYVPPAAAVTAINDTNGYTAKVNQYDLDIYAETGSTVTVPALGTGVVTRGLVDGPGSVSNLLRQYPGSPRRSLTWFLSGSLAGQTGAGVFRYYNDSPNPIYLRSVRATVGTAPTGASIIVDVNIGGSTAFTTQANRPTIAAAATTSGKVTNMNVVAVPAGGYITVDLDQIGSTVAGSNLAVEVDIS